MTKTNFKFVSLIVTFAFLLSTMGSLFPVYAATVFNVDTLIEAEKTTLGSSVEVTRDKNASGKKYISCTGDMKDPSKIEKADVTFDFNVPADGTYAVYAKVIITDGGKDSFYFKFNKNDWKDVHPGEKGEDYVWIKLGEDILKAGKNTFSWNHREQLAIYDAFFVTADESKLPKLSGGGKATPKPTSDATSKPSATKEPDTGDQKLEQFKTTDGGVMFEAEKATVNKKLVEVVNSSSASGKKAVKMAVDDRETPAEFAHAGLGFEIVADKAGQYNVWVRVIVPGGGSDSYWLSKGGAVYAYTDLTADATTVENYTWQKVAMIALTKDQAYSIRMIPRETGALMDKFMVTNNTTFVPEGKGTLPKPGDVSRTEMPKDAYPAPTITPPPEHPRVLFRASDIDTIKKNFESEENKAAYAEFEKLKETEYIGILEDKGDKSNFDSKGIGIIEAKAFDYVINGNEQHGREAITAIKNYAATATYIGIHDYTRQMGQVVFTAGEVYDWCYPLLTKEDKATLAALCQNIGSQMEVGYPPKGQGAVCGHGGELQLLRDWLAFSIATYDEYPDMYNFCGGRVLSEYVKTRNYWYASKSHHQGSAYGNGRYECELWSQWLLYRMSGVTPYVPEMREVCYQWIYTRRPDGQLLREGDDYNENTQKNKFLGIIGGPLFQAANFYKDPVLKREFLRISGTSSFSYGPWSRTPVEFLILNDPTVGREKVETLPLTFYQPSPKGAMIARTGWDMGMNSPDVLAYMNISEVWGANHNHRDAGNFQIYYKGILASESGYYESYGTPHDSKYNKNTVAHNTLLIESEKDPAGNQRIPGGEPATYEQWMKNGAYETGEVIGHEFGPDAQKPEYTYIAGDLAKAYYDNTKEALRSMLFMPLDDTDHPAAFVVFDKITTDKAGYAKKFMLHMQHEPSVEGNVSKIVNNVDGYNGMLTNQTLLPADANIEMIGGEGKEFWMGDRNYALKAPASDSALEEGWGRIEISPKKTGTIDYMLNVMYVNDADKDLALEKAQLIETDSFAGAKIFNRVAMFNKNKARTKDAVSFTVPGDDAELKVNVAGLEAGTWSIKVNGTDIGTQIASEDGGIIYFTAPAGSYELTYAGTDKDKKFTDSGKPYVEGVSLFFNGNYLYSDVPPTIIDDRTLVPMRALLEAMSAEVSWDEATATATVKAAVKGKETIIRITENQKTVYVNDEPVEIDVPAMIINGRFVIPVRFVSETLGAIVNWNADAERVEISGKFVIKKWDLPNVIAVQHATQSGDDGAGNTIQNSLDVDYSTRWAASGKGGEAWGIYEFDQVYSLDKVKLSYYNGGSRVYGFDIAVSEDGVNYTTVISGGKSSGTTDKLEDYDLGGVKAKYVKYIGQGNTTNDWNSVTEIVFIKK